MADERAADPKSIHEGCCDDTDISCVCDVESPLEDGHKLDDVRRHPLAGSQGGLLSVPDVFDQRGDAEGCPIEEIGIDLTMWDQRVHEGSAR